MKYQTGNTRDEPSVATLEAAQHGKEFALLESLLIFVLCITIVLIPIVGLFA